MRRPVILQKYSSLFGAIEGNSFLADTTVCICSKQGLALRPRPSERSPVKQSRSITGTIIWSNKQIRDLDMNIDSVVRIETCSPDAPIKTVNSTAVCTGALMKK